MNIDIVKGKKEVMQRRCWSGRVDAEDRLLDFPGKGAEVAFRVDAVPMEKSDQISPLLVRGANALSGIDHVRAKGHVLAFHWPPCRLVGKLRDVLPATHNYLG